MLRASSQEIAMSVEAAQGERTTQATPQSSGHTPEESSSATPSSHGGGAGLPAGYLAYYGLQRKEAEAAVQRRGDGATPITDSQVHDTAAQGVSGGGGSLPHLDAVQRSF